MDASRDTARGIARLEGYLLYQAEMKEAQARAEAFAERLPWLTRTQHEAVVQLYAEECIALTRQSLRTTRTRIRELQGDYSTRYDDLRRRLLCTFAAWMLGALALCSCALLFTRAR